MGKGAELCCVWGACNLEVPDLSQHKVLLPIRPIDQSSLRFRCSQGTAFEVTVATTVFARPPPLLLVVLVATVGRYLPKPPYSG
jgi:hypothetical protein